MLRHAILLTIVVSCPLRAQQQGQVTLRQNFQSGRYVIAHEMASQGVTTMGPQSLEQSSTMKLVISLNMQASKDNVTTVNMKFDRIAHSFSQNGQLLLEYDSDSRDDPKSPLASIYRPLLETAISFEITPDGGIRNIRGLDELWERLARENPRLAPLAEQMKKQFGPQLIENVVVQGADFYPNHPVGAGDSWTAQSWIEAPLIGRMDIQQNVTLTELRQAQDGPLARLNVTGKAGMGQPRQMTVGETTMTLTGMDLDQTSDMLMNVQTGMVHQQDTVGKVNTSMYMEGPQGERVDVSSEQDFTGKTVICRDEDAQKAVAF